MKLCSLWIGDELPPWAQLCLVSQLEVGHSVDLYSYRKFEVPPGVRLCDAASVFPYQRVPSYAGTRVDRFAVTFSDLFRLKLLQREAGVWCDTDVFAIRPFDFDAPFIIPQDSTRVEYDEPALCNYLLKMPADSGLLHTLLEKFGNPGLAVRDASRCDVESCCLARIRNGSWDNAIPFAIFATYALDAEVGGTELMRYVRPLSDCGALWGGRLLGSQIDYEREIRAGAYYAHFVGRAVKKSNPSPDPASFYVAAVKKYGHLVPAIGRRSVSGVRLPA